MIRMEKRRLTNVNKTLTTNESILNNSLINKTTTNLLN